MSQFEEITWAIGLDHARSPGTRRFVKTVKILKQDWTLNIKSYTNMDPPPKTVMVKTPGTKKVRMSGYLQIYNNCKSAIKKIENKRHFDKFLEVGQKEVVLPIHNSLSGNEGNPRSLMITGFMAISDLVCVDPVPKRKSTDTDDPPRKKFKSLVQLSSHLGCLLNEQHSVFTDVKLQCHDVTIPAHKIILSARSPVFAAMFKNQMKENQDGIVCVDDIDSTIFRMMLDFVYSGKTGELTDSTAGQLLFAADKYQLEDLKEICCDYLKSNVSSENALGTLVLGDLHDSNLKSCVLNFVCEQDVYPTLKNREEWGVMQRQKPELAMEVLTSIVDDKYGIRQEFLNI